MKGHCLCGAVAVTMPQRPEFHACHCGMCRRWGGGPAFCVPCTRDELGVEGGAHVRAFGSSEWAERAFCDRCGTHLWYRLLPSDEYMVSVGLFGDEVPFRMAEQIFIDRKPAAYRFADETPCMTEAEVFAKFAPP
ncbi:MAG: GFA family protein [Steroidobacteraceae bacterium]|jgi:hypothetical protein|nr:GFA family protein [Steroidobacteraceae bacterium]